MTCATVSTPQSHCEIRFMVVFLLDNVRSVMYSINMLSGMRIYTSDDIWRQILGDLGAFVADVPENADVDLDDIKISGVLSPLQLKKILLDASDDSDFIKKIFNKDVKLTRLQAKIGVCLYKSGGMTAAQLKNALGYAPDTTTHTVDTAVYQLRRLYGREFIENNKGVYTIGKL